MRPTSLVSRRLAALAVLFTCAAAAFGQMERYDNHKLVRVTLKSDADIAAMLAISGDFWSETLGPGQVVFRVPPERMDALKASNLPFEVVLDNVQTLIDREQRELALRGGPWFDNYKTYDEINAYIDTLVALRPDLVTKIVIGQSLQNRTVYGMKITGPGVATRPAIFYNGCQHAREWISPMTTMYIADHLVREYDTNPRVHEALDKLTYYIVPISNPDGYVYTWTNVRLWRKNRRDNGDGTFGVDTNRNWSIGWGGSGSSGLGSDDTYRGTAPFSEPETQIQRDFAIAHPEIVAHIDFHSYSQLILSPYGYNTSEPAAPDGPTFRDLDARFAAAIASIHGQTYVAGPTGATLYIASGAMSDWTYEARGVWGWGVELRDTGASGFVLPASEIVPTGEENFELVLQMADVFEDSLQIRFPNGVPATIQAGGQTIDVEIAPLYDTVQASSPTLYWRVAGGSFAPVPLLFVSGVLYRAALPAVPCGRTIEFYVSASDSTSRVVQSPDAGASGPYSATSVNQVTLFADDMEAGTNGWTVGDTGDNATTGLWSRSDPQGTTAQPEDDHTPGAGVNCWVTDGRAGTSAGQYDVDGGKTTLKTPPLNLATASDPAIGYWRWYSNSAGGAPNADTFRVDIAGSAAGPWTNVETVGPSGAGTSGGWIYHEFRVRSVLPTLTATVTLRFVADDAGTGSLIEAAIDDFSVVDGTCPSNPCPGDLTGDQKTDSADLGLLLSAWMASAAGDLNGDGQTESADLGILLADWNCGVTP
ncbi:MAG: M14 family zinc carboxypeptidase [Phycisphaerae bacterium]